MSVAPAARSSRRCGVSDAGERSHVCASGAARTIPTEPELAPTMNEAAKNA